MYSHDNIIEKLTKLTELVNVSDLNPNYTDDSDLNWCKRLLSDVKDSGLIPDKTEFNMANLMWKKYNGGVSKNDDVMWSLVDMLLTQDNPSKIGAIKIYRKFIDSTLRDAKEAVDAREHSIKNGWIK